MRSRRRVFVRSYTMPNVSGRRMSNSPVSHRMSGVSPARRGDEGLGLAEHIRTARQHGIPIVAEPPLTRLIHKLVPEGREIPAQLYRAGAEVLASVYRLRKRRG